ncbi:type I 3-dehydroquinate dehydratase [Lapidilactobacillus mulanensis]|uniref:3-dehydroquinate dehydratase n=1 Tax=Lapidilactobacillus mulanensis TaxID=2485999 RepID=A0ABW4DJU3_9LACO|nr:type I 3-dehydroquinate dehydratase [Lapidilactobacillus mulanensis]
MFKLTTEPAWLGVSITAINLHELTEQIVAIQQLTLRHPLLIEWRLDYWQDWRQLTLKQANQRLRRAFPQQPLLLTLRTSAEGGHMSLNRVNYWQHLLQIGAELEGDLLDIMPAQLPENIAVAQIHRYFQSRLIFSRHVLGPQDYATDLADLLHLGAGAAPADLLKLAILPNSPDEVLDLLQATWQVSQRVEQPIISMSMGDVGRVSRVIGPLFGSVLSFGSVGATSAPGQFALKQLDDLLVDHAIGGPDHETQN